MQHDARAIDNFLANAEPLERAVALVAAIIRHDGEPSRAVAGLIATAGVLTEYLTEIDRLAVARIMHDRAIKLIELESMPTTSKMNGATVRVCE